MDIEKVLVDLFLLVWYIFLGGIFGTIAWHTKELVTKSPNIITSLYNRGKNHFRKK